MVVAVLCFRFCGEEMVGVRKDAECGTNDPSSRVKVKEAEKEERGAWEVWKQRSDQNRYEYPQDGDSCLHNDQLRFTQGLRVRIRIVARSHKVSALSSRIHSGGIADIVSEFVIIVWNV